MMMVKMESMVNGIIVEMIQHQNAKGTPPKSQMSLTSLIQSGSVFILGKKGPMEPIVKVMNVIKTSSVLVNIHLQELVLLKLTD